MSLPKCSLELSNLAKLDLRDILSYTAQTWGSHQLIEYRNKIDKALNAIAQNPLTGREWESSALRVFCAGRHLIFYRINGSKVYIVRILHSQMNIDSHLDG